MTNIAIYKSKEGNISLEVSLSDETIWLSMNQMATLFKKDKSVISRHLNNIYKIKELSRDETVAKFATVQKEGSNKVTRDIEYYNLDAIISVGYRVNSIEGVKFRKWATSVLKEYLTKGYATNDKRLNESGLNEIKQSISLLEKTLTKNELVSDIGAETIQLIMSYSKTWDLLLAYDEEKLKLPNKDRKKPKVLDYKIAKKSIEALKVDLMSKGDASELFARERDKGLESILENIEQTFDNQPLYKSVTERAAHLLYFIIKNHPFTDGNKRVGCFIFLLYLRKQSTVIKLNENGLVALALLIAESNPCQKDMIIRLTTNLIQ